MKHETRNGIRKHGTRNMEFQTPNTKTRNTKHGKRNTKHETRNTETRNTKQETQNPKDEITEHEARNTDHKIRKTKALNPHCGRGVGIYRGGRTGARSPPLRPLIFRLECGAHRVRPACGFAIRNPTDATRSTKYETRIPKRVSHRKCS